MKSLKSVKKLEEIVLPFLLRTSVAFETCIQGKRNLYFPNKPTPISPTEYEVIRESDYAAELKH